MRRPNSNNPRTQEGDITAIHETAYPRIRSSIAPHELDELYTPTVANLLIFYNVVAMTRVLSELVADGYQVTREFMARLSPYKTEYINRFGSYERHFDRVPLPIGGDLAF